MKNNSNGNIGSLVSVFRDSSKYGITSGHNTLIASVIL